MTKVLLGSSTSVESGQRISLKQAVSEIISESALAGKLFVFNDFYEDIERVYEFCKHCPKRAYKLAYIDGKIRQGPSGEEYPLLAAPFPDDVTPAWKIMVEQRGLFTPAEAWERLACSDMTVHVGAELLRHTLRSLPPVSD